jgi:hypothetical protein
MHNGTQQNSESPTRYHQMEQSIAKVKMSDANNTEAKKDNKHTLCQKQRSMCDTQTYKKKVFHQC